MRTISDSRRMRQIATLVYRLRMTEMQVEDLRRRVFELRSANTALEAEVRALTKRKRGKG